MTTKEFHQGAYNKYDKVGVRTVIDLVKNWGFQERVRHDLQPNRWKAGDVELYLENVAYLFEVEVKNGWKTTGDWESRFVTVDVPYRKKVTQSDFICLVNQPRNSLVIFAKEVVLQSPYSPKSTCNEFGQQTDGELFFNIKPLLGRWYTKVNGIWRQIKELHFLDKPYGTVQRYVKIDGQWGQG